MNSLRRAVWRNAPLLLSLTALFWAGNAVLGRAVADTFPPVTLAQGRWLLAAALVLPFAWGHLRRDLPEMRRHLGILLLLSLTGITLFNTLQYTALTMTSALNVVLLQSTMPVLIGLASFALFRERPRLTELLGVAVSLAGVAIVVTGGAPGRIAALALNPGDLVFLAALAIYAVYSALLRKRPPIHWLSFLAATLTLGALMLLPAWVVEAASGRFPPLSAETLFALAYVATFPSIIAYICYNRGVELIGANRAGPYFHLVPLFGAVLSILFLGESLRWFHLVGAVLILAGVFVAQRGRSLQASDPAGAR